MSLTSKEALAIYGIGIGILIGAIIINIAATSLEITPWNKLFTQANDEGLSKTFKELSFVSWIFLFIIYPLLLGLIAFYTYKFLL